MKAPSIGLAKSIEPMARLTDGKLSPPPGQVIWYSPTVPPGQPGNSLIVGHVSYGPPDVFWNLADIKVGADISVGCQSGQVLELTVVSKRSVNKQQLLDGPIWDASPQPWTNFVTCDKYSPVVGTHHTNNLVVRTQPKK